MHHSSTSLYTPNFIEIRKKKFFWTDVCDNGRTDVATNGWTFPPLMLLGRLGGVDLKMEQVFLKAGCPYHRTTNTVPKHCRKLKDFDVKQENHQSQVKLYFKCKSEAVIEAI